MLVKYWSGIVKCQSNAGQPLLHRLSTDTEPTPYFFSIMHGDRESDNSFVTVGEPLYLLDAFATSA